METTNLLSNNPTLKAIWISLALNVLLCCTLLPLALQPDQVFTLQDLLEVILWQGMALVGWPMALVMGFVQLISQGIIMDTRSLLSLLVYPTGLVLLALTIFLKRGKMISLILLHLLIILSFVVTWYSVRNGYDFMLG